MTVSIIAAVANNGVIGNKNRLIWHMPADLKFFRKTTLGHIMIMGRKTFESIGKPLPGRKTIIVTKQLDYKVEGCQIAHSYEEALKLSKNEKHVFVVGGAQIYEYALNHKATKNLYLTRIFAAFDGDTFFPEVDCSKWELMERNDFEPDKDNKYPFSFMIYKRKKRRLFNFR
ncbi:MAG: dihydrofolate reductase [Bacteroidetes bacterium]|nr:dihydrofolate reductase [Bacteroidota bacterium]